MTDTDFDGREKESFFFFIVEWFDHMFFVFVVLIVMCVEGNGETASGWVHLAGEGRWWRCRWPELEFPVDFHAGE